MRTLVLALLVATGGRHRQRLRRHRRRRAAMPAALTRRRSKRSSRAPTAAMRIAATTCAGSPVEMLAFVGVRPGMVVLDVSAGGGYTTELLARAGRAERPRLRARPRARRRRDARGARRRSRPAAQHRRRRPAVRQPGSGRASRRAASTSSTLMFNYHDFGHHRRRPRAHERAVFAALKPGGVYVVADHAGRAGTGISESATLHRVEEALRPARGRGGGLPPRRRGRASCATRPTRATARTPDPPQPKDEFVLKFVKP